MGYIVADAILSTVSHMKCKVMYLLASDDEGKLIEIIDGEVGAIIAVPNWTDDDKENFKK